jgi:hypothetical protein
MFQRLPIVIKILLLCCSNLISFSIAIWTYFKCTLNQTWLEKTSGLFLLTWSLIFASFVFFQIFKNFRFPTFYYNQNNFETFHFYRSLGVKVFRQILIHSFFRYLNQRIYFKRKNKAEFSRIIAETQQSETSHVLSGLVTLIFQGSFLIQGDYFSFGMLGSFNVLFNLYPILLQRMNRFTFTRILDKFS